MKGTKLYIICNACDASYPISEFDGEKWNPGVWGDFKTAHLHGRHAKTCTEKPVETDLQGITDRDENFRYQMVLPDERVVYSYSHLWILDQDDREYDVIASEPYVVEREPQKANFYYEKSIEMNCIKDIHMWWMARHYLYHLISQHDVPKFEYWAFGKYFDSNMAAEHFVSLWNDRHPENQVRLSDHRTDAFRKMINAWKQYGNLLTPTKP